MCYVLFMYTMYVYIFVNIRGLQCTVYKCANCICKMYIMIKNIDITYIISEYVYYIFADMK